LAISKKQERIEALITELMQTIGGYDKSESATEAFILDLNECTRRVMYIMHRSHEEGCCYNCVAALGDLLAEWQPSQREHTHNVRVHGGTNAKPAIQKVKSYSWTRRPLDPTQAGKNARYWLRERRL